MWVLSMKLTLTALTVAATMFASSASAFDPADLQKLMDTGMTEAQPTSECEGCDLSDLVNDVLSFRYLQNANLKGVNLMGTYLVGTNMKGADLTGANLKGANLLTTNLKGANLEGANLQNANLKGANLEGANLKGANLEGVKNLRFARMTGAILAAQDFEENSLVGNRPMIRPKGVNIKVEGTSVKPPADPLAAALAEALKVDPLAAALAEPLKVFEAKDHWWWVIQTSLSRCWNLASLSDEDLKTKVSVGVEFSPEGKIIDGSISLKSHRDGNSGSVAVAFENAKKAILQCWSKGIDLPKEHYSKWQKINLTFDASLAQLR